MAYQGGYADQRPYNGPMHHDQRGYGGGGGPPQPPQNYGAPQHYDNYHDGYGYDDHHNTDPRAYGQGYADQYPDPAYDQRQPHPQQDHRGRDPRMGAQPPHAGRGGGGYPPRGGIAPGPAREHRPEAVHGNGRPQAHGHNSDPSPAGHRTPSHGGDPRARNQDQQMAEQMGRMRLNGYDPRLAPKPRASMESQRSQEHPRPPASAGRGRPPPQRVYSQHSTDEPGRGPPAQDQGGYNAYNNAYNREPDMHSNSDFGPPARSQTMPAQSQYMDPPPQRHHSVPHEDQAGHGMQPRPPPQRQNTSSHYSDHYDQQWDSHYNGGHADAQHDYGQQPRRSFTQPYGSEYSDPRGAAQGYDPYDDTKRSSLPDFDNIPRNGRGSFEETMRPGPGPGFEQPQPGAHQTAKLNHAKSQPDLRQPQSAVFEMPADVPSVPPLPQFNNLPSQRTLSYSGDGNVPHRDPGQMPPRGPSAPPGATTLPRPSQASRAAVIPPVPPASAPQLNSDPDALPSHPTPVRAGLMSGSVVNLNAKPPPVRNYGAVPQAGAPQAQGMQQAQSQPPPIQTRAQPTKQPQAPVTPQELEHLRMVIKNNPNDTESALRLAKRLIEAVDVLVPRIPDPRARARGRERYLMDAHKILKKQCNAQNSEAMFTLADSLGRGLFRGDSDSKEAFTLYQSAAKLGHGGAAYRTAVCCEIGQDEGGGTRKDPLKAIQWYKRAATLGDTPAMYKVGMILLKGLLGQPRNPREAIGWLKRAAERADPENPHALHELGLLYESAQPNDAIIRDEKYAFSLFLQAAELGYKFSQFRLGCAFEYGSLGCPVDPRQSIMWYSRAAQREEHQAELALSGWYLTGSEGVMAQSDVEAYLWARKAAVAGLAKAEYAMGYFTEVGIGTAPNLEDAKRWYWRAAAQDFPKARDRLEELKRVGRNAPRQRERISRSKIETQPEGECSVM